MRGATRERAISTGPGAPLSAALAVALAPGVARAQEQPAGGASYLGFLVVAVLVCLAVAFLVIGGRRRTVKKAPSPPAARRPP